MKEKKQLHEQLWEDFLESVASQMNGGDTYEREWIISEAKKRVENELYDRSIGIAADSVVKLKKGDVEKLKKQVLDFTKTDRFSEMIIKEFLDTSSWDKKQVLKDFIDGGIVSRWQVVNLLKK